MATKSIPLFISVYTVLACGILIFLILNFFRKKSETIAIEKRRKVYIPIFLILITLLIQSILAFNGFFHNFELPPRLLIGVLPVLAIFLISGFSFEVFQILREFGSHRLVFFQVWRFLPEVLILLLIREGLLSEIMSIRGQNFDLLVPASAPILYLAIRRNAISGNWIILWNGISIAVLSLTVFTGVMSAPFPFQFFHTNPSNEIMTLFPVSYLPLFMVPLAFSSHILGIAIGWSEWKQRKN